MRPTFFFLCALILSLLLAGCTNPGAAPSSGTGTTAPEFQPVEVPASEPETGKTSEDADRDDRTPEQKLEDEMAAGHISWENAPRIGDRDALMRYMRSVRDHRLTEAPVIYLDGYMADYEEILKAVNLAYIDFEIRAEEENALHVLYTLTYYPGERVADAYHRGSTEGLSEDEQRLYEEAVFLVGEANKLPSELHKELFLHDQVIGRATYHNHKERVGVPRYCTAVGALLDGQANCQGYTDAFYMLGAMAGLTVGKQSGSANGELHVWNSVLLDGKWYALDCTWDDASYTWNGTEYTSYTYFNAPASVLEATHSYEAYTIEHPVVKDLSDADDYFYLTDEATDVWFGHYFTSMEALVSDAAERLDRGARFVYAMAPSDTEHYKKYSAVAKAIDGKLKHSAKYVVILTNSGDYSFVLVDASAGRPAETGPSEGGAAEAEETQSGSAGESLAIEQDGVYTSAEDVARYLVLYGELPGNFITKKEAASYGWEGGSLEPYAPGKCIGGDYYGNYEGLLPKDKKYRECDIDTLGARGRGAKRLIYADDGSIYYTEDHYESFKQLY